jgi:ribosome-interacting GTPase 1
MGILEKIADIEREIARTQKNKATEHHLGILKVFISGNSRFKIFESFQAKLAKFRSQLLEPTGGKKGGGEGFDVMKSGGIFIKIALGHLISFFDRCSRGTTRTSIRRKKFPSFSHHEN